MICYLIRHGKDDDSLRGGWSDSPLTSEGIKQVECLASQIRSAEELAIGTIYSSDLPRALQTAEILSSVLSLPVVALPEFRETNNGVLAGMHNQTAAARYPGLYWSALGWEEPYPGGESPCQFYNRISEAWRNFKNALQGADHDVILVTHGGVINVIQCIEHEIIYSNKANPFPVDHAEMVGISI